MCPQETALRKGIEMGDARHLSMLFALFFAGTAGYYFAQDNLLQVCGWTAIACAALTWSEDSPTKGDRT